MKNLLEFFNREMPPMVAGEMRYDRQSQLECPEFNSPRKEDLIRWFDLNFCNFYSNDQKTDNPNSIEFELQKRKWLMNSENEAWYLARVSVILHAAEFIEHGYSFNHRQWLRFHNAAVVKLKESHEKDMDVARDCAEAAATQLNACQAALLKIARLKTNANSAIAIAKKILGLK